MVLGKSEHEGIEPRPKFLFPVTTLIGEQFRLEPFETIKHADAYWDGTGTGPELYAYMRLGPFNNKEQFIEELVEAAETNPTVQVYAIMTTRKPNNIESVKPTLEEYSLAGITAYNDASKASLKVEIGPIILLSSYQGTGLAPAVVDLMVQHALKDTLQGGWGIRRVQWMAHAANVASIKLAERLKFQREGLFKWDMVFRDGKSKGKVGNGRPLPESSQPGDLGRDTVLFSRCWDD